MEYGELTSGPGILETQACTECANNPYSCIVNKRSLFFMGKGPGPDWSAPEWEGEGISAQEIRKVLGGDGI